MDYNNENLFKILNEKKYENNFCVKKTANNKIVFINILSFVILIILFQVIPIKIYGKFIYYYICFGIWYISTVFIDASWIKKTYPILISILLFLIINTIWTIIRFDQYFVERFFQNYFLFMFWPLFYIFYKDNFSKLFFKRFSIFQISLILIFCISTIIGLKYYPSASREMATINISFDNMILYAKNGIGGFDFVYSLVFLQIPLLCIIFTKNKNYNKIYICIMLILDYLAIYSANYTISLLLSSLALLLFLICYFLNYNIKYILIYISLLLIFLYIFRFILIKSAISFFELKDKTIYIRRLNEIYAALKNNDILNLERFQLYKESIDTFLKNPFVGTLFNESELIGQHSDIFDNLGRFGMFSIIYFSYYYFAFNIIRRLYKNYKIKCMFTVVEILLFVLRLCNPILASYDLGLYIFFIIPMIFLVIDKNTPRDLFI